MKSSIVGVTNKQQACFQFYPPTFPPHIPSMANGLTSFIFRSQGMYSLVRRRRYRRAGIGVCEKGHCISFTPETVSLSINPPKKKSMTRCRILNSKKSRKKRQVAGDEWDPSAPEGDQKSTAPPPSTYFGAVVQAPPKLSVRPKVVTNQPTNQLSPFLQIQIQIQIQIQNQIQIPKS